MSTCSTARNRCRAQVDLNCVMDKRAWCELQRLGEGRAFTPEEQQALVLYAEAAAN